MPKHTHPRILTARLNEITTFFRASIINCNDPTHLGADPAYNAKHMR
jgi:hypothetical protein